MNRTRIIDWEYPIIKPLTGLVFMFFFATTFIFSQTVTHKPGEFLVQITEGIDPTAVAKANAIFEGRQTQLAVKELISPHLSIYTMTFDYGNIHEIRFLNAIKSNPNVVTAQFNHRVELRTELPPNDPFFSNQWHLLNTGQLGGTRGADIKAIEAWEITTGGLTAHGDTIVIAVIDDGINLNHPDLQGLIWKNHHEVANTGEDDDGNGYIDDIYGWNTFNNSGNVSGGFLGGHGTPVSGMIGAIANNNEGVAGINWNIKIMTIIGGNGFESNAIQAYTYALTQRQIYNETNGERGAFVVATNSSWGRDGADPNDSPLWCAFYDLMGEYGILSTGATTNRNWNVDEVGDLPTGCSSEFLLSVTATNPIDRRANTGYGRNSIELGAPGFRVWSTRNNGEYSESTGTSFASPLVAGVIGLAYSIPCESFMNISKTDPARAATMVRQAILEGVDPLESLREETITGGRLNAYNSLVNLIDMCMDCPHPTINNVSTDFLDSIEISWTPILGTTQTNLRYSVDSSDWIVLENMSSPFNFDLEWCTEYVFEIQAVCDSIEGEWVRIDSIKTGNCCEPPSQFEVNFDSTTATVSWNQIIPAFEYNVRFRKFGDEFWDITPLWQFTEKSFFGLEPCAFYEFQVQARCETGFTEYSEIITLETPECFNCNLPEFCRPDGISAENEWIDTLMIEDVLFPTGPGEGFVESTGVVAAILNFGETKSLRLVTGSIVDPQFPQYFRIWIDFNRDGIFAENELIFDPGRSLTEPLDTTLLIPDIPSSFTGHARMRISMKYMEKADSIPPILPCESFEFGQVYDFCVFLYRPFIACPEVDEVIAVDKTPSSFTAIWNALDIGLAYNLRYRALGSDEWEEVATPDTFFVVSELSPCSPYEVQVRGICPFDTSNYSVSYILFTECPNTVIEVEPEGGLEVSLYPNPFHSWLNLEVTAQQGTQGDYTVRIFNLTGNLISVNRISLYENSSTTVPAEILLKQPPGLYFIEISDGVRRKVVRALKQ